MARRKMVLKDNILMTEEQARDEAVSSNSLLEADVANLKRCLKEAIRYVETTDGTRGDLVGCQVNANTFLDWVRASNRAIDGKNSVLSDIKGVKVKNENK